MWRSKSLAGWAIAASAVLALNATLNSEAAEVVGIEASPGPVGIGSSPSGVQVRLTSSPVMASSGVNQAGFTVHIGLLHDADFQVRTGIRVHDWLLYE